MRVRTRLAALLLACGSINAAKYNVGDTLSAEDRAIQFVKCDGTTASLGSFLDAGKAVVLDKSFYT